MTGPRGLLAVVLLVAACSAGGRSASTEAGAPDPGAPVASTRPSDEPAVGGWERLDDLPIPGRATAVTFWIEGELVVVGGDTFTCPDMASCFPPDEPPFADGAALDPATGRWREIADAPVGFSSASVAVVGADAYLLARGNGAPSAAGPAFLRWSATDDTWSDLPLPPGGPDWYQLVAAGGEVVAYSGSEEAGVDDDLVFDPVAETWEVLPPDPFPPSFDRYAVWADPHLYLFAKDIGKVSGPDPAVIQVARLALATRTWEHLPDSDRIGYGPWLAEDGEITSPDTGSADGGEVDGWGRAYLNGGTYDIATGEWRDLPPPPARVAEAGAAGIVGTTGAVWTSPGGVALDVTRDAWIDLPELPDPELAEARPLVAAAGRDAVAVAGYRWSEPVRQVDARMLTETWIWRPPA